MILEREERRIGESSEKVVDSICVGRNLFGMRQKIVVISWSEIMGKRDQKENLIRATRQKSERMADADAKSFPPEPSSSDLPGKLLTVKIRYVDPFGEHESRRKRTADRFSSGL